MRGENDNWTAEEYREYLRTGKEPSRRAASPCCCQAARPSGVSAAEMEAEQKRETDLEELRERLGQRDRVKEAKFNGLRERFEQRDRETEARKRKIEKTVREARRKETERDTLEGGKKPRKYRNEPTLVDGIRFDSKHEARVYQELMLRVRAGELKNVLLQVPFLLPGGIRYFADFVTITPDMRIEGVYDAKSEATRKNRVYINKKKQLKALWDIDIIEV